MNFRKLKLVWRLRKFLTRVVKLMVQQHEADLERFVLAYLVGNTEQRKATTRRVGVDLLKSFAEAAE